MQQSTENTASSILGTQLSGEGNPNREPYSEAITNQKLEGSPFNIMGNSEHGFCITLGKYKVTESEEWDDRNETTLQEKGEHMLEKYKWEIILNCIAVFINEYVEKK